MFPQPHLTSQRSLRSVIDASEACTTLPADYARRALRSAALASEHRWSSSVRIGFRPSHGLGVRSARCVPAGRRRHRLLDPDVPAWQGARDHPVGLDVPASRPPASRSRPEGMDRSSPRTGIRFHCVAGSSAAPPPGPAASRGGGGGVLVRRRGGAGGLRWRPGRRAGQRRTKHAGHGLVPGGRWHVASGKQRHQPASVRRGLPERAAVRGGGCGGHHRVHRRWRQDVAGPGQSAARVIDGAVRDRVRRAEFVLCDRAAGHHPGDARRRRVLEPPCAARRRVRRGPHRSGVPARLRADRRPARAVPPGPAGHRLRQRPRLLRGRHRAAGLRQRHPGTEDTACRRRARSG